MPDIVTISSLQASAREKFDNLVFPSKENDGIEHMDCSYEEFFQLLDSLIASTLSEIEESVVPEEKQIKGTDAGSFQMMLAGFNDCRAEMKRKFAEMKNGH